MIQRYNFLNQKKRTFVFPNFTTKNIMQKVLFIDRDGTLINEPPITFQVDRLDQLEFLPGVIRNLYFIQKTLDFKLVIVTNQDGLGTEVYPQENFDAVQKLMLQIFENETILFDEILVDKSFPEDNLPTRKPGTGLLGKYMTGDYDLENSYVIGDRLTDAQLAENLGCKSIILNYDEKIENEKCKQVKHWDEIAEFLFAGERTAESHRVTKETDVYVAINLDGEGTCDIDTGLHFFDHMLEQIGRHSGCNLTIKVKGDLHIDEHHTIEDTAIVLGDVLKKSLGNKRGVERYGFCLPMDDCLCTAALDFGGRAWLVMNADFKREKVGDMPTEMVLHFFKSLTDAAAMNLNIKAEGDNEHHKIEGMFKAFAKSIKMAKKRDIYNFQLPSSKGML